MTLSRWKGCLALLVSYLLLLVKPDRPVESNWNIWASKHDLKARQERVDPNISDTLTRICYIINRCTESYLNHWSLRSQLTQVVVVVRHGESEFNAMSKSNGVWQDPRVFDPHLTAKGCNQAVELRGRLQCLLRNNKHINCHSPDDILWVSSPLQRCLETLLLACPALPQFSLSTNRTFRTGHLQSELHRTVGAAFPKIKITRFAPE